MALDIYVRWDDMTDEEIGAQFTGQRDSPGSGYMRFSWGGVEACYSYADEAGAPNPISCLYPVWDGGSGDLLIDADVLRDLVDARAQLAEWLQSGIPQEIKLIDFPDVPPAELRQWFIGKVQCAVALIDFIESKKDRPGLRLEFRE